MTAKDAFAQAFDEAFVMDALPSMGLGGEAPNPAASGIQKNPAKATSMGGMNGAGGGGEISLAEHVKVCEAKTPESCPYVKKMAKQMAEQQGVDIATAMQQAISEHSSMAEQVKNGGVPTGGQPQEPTPEMIAQQTQQIAENPQTMEQVQSLPLEQPEVVSTEVGDIPVQTTMQKGIVENLNEQAVAGNVIAEKGLSQLKEDVDSGKITSTEEPSQIETEGAEAPPQPVESPTIFTSDGKFSRKLTPEESAIIQENPEKLDTLQAMVDLEAKVNSASGSEQKDLRSGYETLKRMFYGRDIEGEPSGKQASTPKTAEKEQTSVGTESGGEKASAPSEEPPPSGEIPSAPTEEPSPSEQPRRSSVPSTPPTPSDEEFSIGKNKYKVGGMVYTDVSGKGLLRTMLSSFMAGLRGEGIITGWDRISGTWDQMKRSEKGEMVRDGIAGALIKNTIADYANKVGLPDDAKMELAAIQDMVNQAKSPKENMAAVKQFQKWKEKYSKELGEMEKPKPGEAFKPLPNDYKGTTPPIDILDTPKGFDADKQFGDNVAAAIQERMGLLGFPIESLDGISVGPSATVVEFKIPPTFDMSAAQSKKVREALKGAIGTDVSKVEYAAGKTDTLSIQVTNPKMRDVSFSDCISSNEWKNFSEKADLPVTLGKDASGKNVNLDLAKQPHTIVKGESGSGKSVFLLAAINSLEMAKTPDKARIVLLDPKNEFRSQDGSPHLLYPRAQKPQDIANVISSLKSLMEDRIAKVGGVVKDFDPTKNEFQGNSDRTITEYNKLHPEDRMPHVLMTFDEVASIMKNPDVGDRVKQDLSQILALGRSVGINCILATQRDDVASIPGEIQANAPAKIAFKAAPNDAKATQEEKSLAGSGDFIMTDKGGKQTRGRGCFISDKEVAAVPAYYRDNMEGKPTESDKGGEGGKKLPQGHLDAIEQAVANGQSISMEAEEGFMDAFKGAFPSDWSITEEEVDGKKHWKASPPSKPTSSEPSTPAEPPKKKIEKVEDVDDTVDYDDVNSLKDYVSRLQDAVKEVSKKYPGWNNKAKRDRAIKPFMERIEEVNAEIAQNFPDADLEDGDDSLGGSNTESTAQGSNTQEEKTPEGATEDSKAAFATMQRLHKRAIENIDKKLEKSTSMRESAKLSAEKKQLEKRFADAKAKYEAGGSADDITNIYEPEESNEQKATGSGTETQQSETAGGEAESGSAEQPLSEEAQSSISLLEDEYSKKQKEIAKNANLSAGQKETRLANLKKTHDAKVAAVKSGKTISQLEAEEAESGKAIKDKIPTTIKGKPIPGAKHILESTRGDKSNIVPMPKDLVSKASANLPDGFVIDSDVNGRPLWDGKKGFARDPKTGMYGLIKSDGTFNLQVDPTNPQYKGIGTPEAEEAKQAWLKNKDKSKDAELLEKYNYAAFGVPKRLFDEAPDNMTIVTNAVADALKLIRG